MKNIQSIFSEYLSEVTKPDYYLVEARYGEDEDSLNAVCLPFTEEELEHILNLQKQDTVGVELWELLEGDHVLDRFEEQLRDYTLTEFHDLMPRKIWNFSISYQKDGNEVTNTFESFLTDEEAQKLIGMRLNGEDFILLTATDPNLAEWIEGPARFENYLSATDDCTISMTEMDECIRKIQK